MTAGTVFIALVLTAMQVGLATDRLKYDERFQQASYGFTVFAILGPLGAFGLAVLGALLNLLKDLPWLFASNRVRESDNGGGPAVPASSDKTKSLGSGVGTLGGNAEAAALGNEDAIIEIDNAGGGNQNGP
ncbi:uncharacterized protein F4822DRAFT_414280 [Hypoxylon trugodes]|uniref:uncharacterized protein n=1 Tax=Hypoxylon trugodes TaxID=326681 RepID=UPI0021971BAA|nr:uncharacterized protein F4822DRAFT_414280 [Hypoxylon trugodes]KAI1385836.1 hypothetical protein F4822DRAFT_414280 [Hypoxylon trugodes]